MDPSARATIDHAALTGRALVAAGRGEEAIALLTDALVRAARRPAAAPGTVKDASAVGEWLGSSVVDLAVCHVDALGDAVGAAAVIEASHADGDVEAARSRVLEAAASTEHGLVTWLTGADRTPARRGGAGRYGERDRSPPRPRGDGARGAASS